MRPKLKREDSSLNRDQGTPCNVAFLLLKLFALIYEIGSKQVLVGVNNFYLFGVKIE